MIKVFVIFKCRILNFLMVDYFHKHNFEDVLKNAHQPLSESFCSLDLSGFDWQFFMCVFIYGYISKQTFTKKLKLESRLNKLTKKFLERLYGFLKTTLKLHRLC